MADGESMVARRARTVGRVRAVEDGTLIVLTPTGKSQRIKTGASTTVVAASQGTVDDIGEGDRLVVKFHADSKDRAREVIVLPPDDVYGLPVMAIEAHLITVKGPLGVLSEVDVSDAIVDTVTPASIDDVERGAIVYGMLSAGENGDFSADEIIVLPGATSFGS